MAFDAVGTVATAQGADVVVVGGGLHGLSSALHLARRGQRVILLERDYCGRHSSGVNAGGVRTMGRHVAEIPLSLASRDEIWHHAQEYLGSDCGFTPGGQLQLIESPAELEVAQERVRLLNGLGYSHEVLIDQREVRRMIPAIAPHVIGGIWVERDGHAWPYGTVMAFYTAALKAGVRIHEGCAVSRVCRQAGVWQVQTPGQVFSAPALVNAAGAWAGELAAQLGDPVPVRAEGLMLMVTQRTPHFLTPVLGATGRPLSLKQFANGTVLIGGGLRCPADAVACYADVDLATLWPSAQTVSSIFPHMAHVPIAHAWGGVEAFMPDGIPVISPSRQDPRVIHAFGFSAHGFELGPIVGRIVSELLCDGKSRLPIDSFSVGRFFETSSDPTPSA